MGQYCAQTTSKSYLIIPEKRTPCQYTNQLENKTLVICSTTSIKKGIPEWIIIHQMSEWSVCFSTIKPMSLFSVSNLVTCYNM